MVWTVLLKLYPVHGDAIPCERYCPHSPTVLRMFLPRVSVVTLSRVQKDVRTECHSTECGMGSRNRACCRLSDERGCPHLCDGNVPSQARKESLLSLLVGLGLGLMVYFVSDL